MNIVASNSISEHPLAIRHAALVLWTDAYWDDIAERIFLRRTGWSAHEIFGQQLMDRPTPQMPEEYVAEIASWLVQAEQVWGRTLPDVATQMERDIRDLAYDVAMEIAGYGVGPGDRDGFPNELEDKDLPSEENPAHGYIPDMRTADLLVENCHPRDYAAQWGDTKTNQAFYNFTNMFDESETWYIETLLKIRLEFIYVSGNTASRIGERRKNMLGLTRLFNITKAAGMNAIGSEAIAKIQLRETT